MRFDFRASMKFFIAGVAIALGSNLYSQNFLLDQNFNGFPNGSAPLPYQGWTNTILAGNASVDQWVFDNPASRTASPPISGKFAIFDSDWNSSGNGAENVALESPTFSAQGCNRVRLQFDEYFDGIYNTGDSILVELFNGSRWVTVYSYNGFAAISNSHDLDITTIVNGAVNAKLRFRFVGDWSFYWMIDNVRVIGFYDYDAKIIGASFSSGVCGGNNDSIEVEVENAGLQAISNFIVRAHLAGSLGSNAVNTTVSHTFSGSLAPGNRATIKLPPFNTSMGGMVSLTAYTEMGGEQNAANDTLKSIAVNFLGTPPIPSVADGIRCGGGSVTLQATGISPSDSVVWYDLPSASIPIGTGSVFSTPSAGPGNYTYYVSSGRGALQNSLSSTYASGNGQSGAMFDVQAHRNLIIDSFEVSMDSGTHLVEVYYKTGTYQGFETNASAWTLLGSTTVTSTMPNGGSGVYVNVGAKLVLAAGANYAFYIQLPNAIVLNYSNTSALQTYSNADLLITAGAGKGANFGATFSPRVFNGALHYSYFPLCEGSRQPVQVHIGTLPVGSALVKGNMFQGTFNTGTQANPHIVAIGDEVNFEISPPTGTFNAEYGSTWTIANIDFRTVNGTQVSSSDTLSFPPIGSTNGGIRFIPNLAASDSLYHLSVTIHSLVTGCDSLLETFVYVAPRPTANFSAISSCDGAPIQFTNTSTIQSGTLAYEWNFGNGNFSSQESPSFVFPTYGNFDVVLKVSSNHGYTDYDTQTVVVRPIPQADFEAINACEGLPVLLGNTTSMPAGTASFFWDFGDSTTATTQNATHLYGQVGSYLVSYTVEVNGCWKTIQKQVTQAPRAKVDFSSLASCNNTTVKFANNSTLLFGVMGYLWDFGDGKFSTSIHPDHDYTGFGNFDVKLKAYTDLGCIDSFSTSIAVIQAPKISLTYSAPCVGETIQFLNSTVVPAGHTNSYDWSFGDGRVSYSTSPSHAYPGAGIYPLSLRSYSTNGCADSFFTTITVNEKPAALIVAPTLVCEGENVAFLNGTVTSNPSALSYEWDFGNGTNSQAYDTSFIYSKPSTYLVTLIARMTGGCSDTTTQSLRVSPLPSANFTYLSTRTQDGTIQFVSEAVSQGISYQWFFGDGDKSTDKNPLHQFLYDGVYQTRLITQNADNCINEKTSAVSIYRTALTDANLALPLSIFPNPNRGLFTLKLTDVLSEEVSISVVNALGQTVPYQILATSSEGLELDLSTASKGVYFLHVKSKSGAQSSLRFVIH